ncbi:MAG: carboxypeptidase regulatory-like domain-containing protein [Bacteroidetes bacterium]|nr:carboxypeptidase regulatory-like domain-containing protein [Bacteroidota bacterium]
MKRKLLLLFAFTLTFAIASKAGQSEPGDEKTTKDDPICLVIHAETKKPLKDVSVTAMLASKKEKVTTTDEDGIFNLEDLKPGIYKFIFEKAGFKKVTKDKIVVKPEGVQLSIEMFELDDLDIMPSPFSTGIGF